MCKKETAPNYSHIVCNIGQNRRVILCKDGLQWIIQSSDGLKCRSTPLDWRELRYDKEEAYRTVPALRRLLRAIAPANTSGT